MLGAGSWPLGPITRQQRFVRREIYPRQECGVGCHTVTFGEDEKISLHDFASGYAQQLAIAEYQRTRTGKVAQSGERVLGLVFLDKSDADNYQDKAEKHEGFAPVAEQEIDCAAGDEQQKHWLACYASRNDKQVARSCCG